MQKFRLSFRSQPHFFGLSEEYIRSIYEQLFYLKQHGHWGFVEAYNLPHRLREWWVERLTKLFADEKKAIESSHKPRR